MGTFTALDADQLSALASAFELGAVSASRAIAAGTINSNFMIETERGRFFLRVNEGKAEVDVAWESRLVGALAERGVVTPTPRAARDGRLYAALPPAGAGADGATKWVSAFAWRAGHHLAADGVTAAHAEQFGGALAALHLAGLELPADWRRSSIYDHDHLVARFATIDAVEDPAIGDEAAQRAFARAKVILRDELAVAAGAASIRRAATHGIIHGDLFRDNVLWDGDAISAILDFEQASGGSLAYDVAVCLNDWCWAEAHDAAGGALAAVAVTPASDAFAGRARLDLAAALLAGYQRVRPLTAADREALPYELRASAARFTITRITDVYLAKVPNPEKDFRAFLARCEAWRTQALHALTKLL